MVALGFSMFNLYGLAKSWAQMRKGKLESVPSAMIPLFQVPILFALLGVSKVQDADGVWGSNWAILGIWLVVAVVPWLIAQVGFANLRRRINA